MEDIEIIDLYVNKKMIAREIADIANTNRYRIYRILDKNNIPRRFRSKSHLRNKDRDDKIVEMHNNNISETKIAKMYGITRQAVDLVLKKCGVIGKILPLCKCGCGQVSRRRPTKTNRYYRILPGHIVRKDYHKIKLLPEEVEKIYNECNKSMAKMVPILQVSYQTIRRYMIDHDIARRPRRNPVHNN